MQVPRIELAISWLVVGCADHIINEAENENVRILNALLDVCKSLCMNENKKKKTKVESVKVATF